MTKSRLQVMKESHPEKVGKDGHVYGCPEEFGFLGHTACEFESLKSDRELMCRVCWEEPARRRI